MRRAPADAIMNVVANPLQEAGWQGRGGSRLRDKVRPVFSGTLVERLVAGQPLDVLIAGDDEEAEETVARLVRDGDYGPSTSDRWSVPGSWRASGSLGSRSSSRWV